MEHSGDEKDPVEVLDPSPLSRPVDGTRIESELTGNARQDRITKRGGGVWVNPPELSRLWRQIDGSRSNCKNDNRKWMSAPKRNILDIN